jgi:hypothetical protein
MFALLKERFGDLEMGRRGSDDVEGIAGGGGIGHGGEGFHAVFGGDSVPMTATLMPDDMGDL